MRAGCAVSRYGTYGSDPLSSETDLEYIRCVRGEYRGIDGADRFQISDTASEREVVDQATGLIWQFQYTTGLLWSGALSYCEGLNYAGSDKWRLPSWPELHSLVDITLVEPTSRFPYMPLIDFWSSTISLSESPQGPAVFYFGFGGRSNYIREGGIRCVRDGE